MTGWKNVVRRATFVATNVARGAIIGLLSAAFILGPIAAARADATLLPNAVQQFLDSSGRPLAFGKVYHYVPSTTTTKTVWSDSGETTALPNPITLDAGGRPTDGSALVSIYGSGTYRQKVTNSTGSVTVWDTLTASTGDGGGGGGTTVGDGNLVGTMLPWTGLSAPNQYVFAFGQAIARATYPDFYTAITLTQSATCISGNSTLGGLASTESIPVGAVIEGSCVVPGSTVVSKTASAVVMSNNASASGTISATFFPWGNGDGATTFNVPDMRGRAPFGRDNMGGTAASRLTATYCATAGLGASCGVESHKNTIAEMAAHNHGGATATGTTGKFIANSNSTGTADPWTYTQGSQLGTTPTTEITVPALTISSQGSTTPYSIMNPAMEVNFVVKVTPDDSSAIATGVASLGGMTGVLACGSGLLCTGNTVSVTGLGVSAAANTVLANATSGTANMLPFSMPSCSTASSALTWTTNSGFGCNTISGSGSLVIGTTTITSGTNGRILYDNAGVLGEYAIPLVVANGGTGAATFTANLPLIGNGTSALTQGTRSGNTTAFVTTTGTQTAGRCVEIDASGNHIAAASGCAGGGLTVGSTTISSGTTTRVLYDNAGVLGEYTISGTGSVAMTTSPTFVTPTLGAATGTSLALGACTPNALCTVGDLRVNSANASTFVVARSAAATAFAFAVDTSIASSATGVQISSKTAGSGVSIDVISSGTNESININPKGSGDVNIIPVGSGNVSIGRPTTISAIGGTDVLTVSGGALVVQGTYSATAWTTSGRRLKLAAASYTDTSSSGTVATAYTDLFGASTILASSSTTYTNYFGSYHVDPVASTNVTMTNKWALGADSLRVGTSNQLTISTAGALTVAGTANFTGTFQISGNAMTFPGAAATLTRTIASGAKALATSAISSGACSSAQTDTATGTATTDAITVAFSADPTSTTGYSASTSGMLSIIYYPTADTVNFKVCNNTASSITPGAVTINWRVTR